MNLKSVKTNNSANKYKVAQDSTYLGDDYWDWSIWIEATELNLNKIKNVVYNLHETFPRPIRIIDSRDNKFKLDTSGWGVFTIYIRINFKNETVLDLEHELELYYPDGKENIA